ncbi:MAG TPA: cytochrome c oxidase assembly protein [Segeticoccus sp.]|nr:cytochrome c oxidase assembly protein [Segeticoccus sp.]
MSGPMWVPMQPPDFARLLAWHPQPVPVLPILCLLGGLLYGWGVWHLRRAGHHWSPGRTVSWYAGLVLIVLVTATGTGGYSMVLFSVHMVQHMVLSMLVPIPLLMGAPITLALRALPSGPGRRGRARRTLLRVLHSRVMAVLSNPLIALPLFLASLYALYFSPLFDDLMGSFVGHTFMLVHFVAVGLLLFWPLLAIDPSPHHHSPFTRIVEMFITAPFHSFFGIAMMTSNAVIVAFFAHPPAMWHVNALHDEQLGGSIAWGFSEVPTLLVVLAIVTLWGRSSEREAKRRDRAADRGVDAELEAYNAWLARLGGQHP